MVKAKVILMAAAVLALAGCSRGPYSWEWHKHMIDGHRTGVTVPSAANPEKAIGTVKDGVYTAPNGKVFKGGATPEVARLLTEVQPELAVLKEVIAYAPSPMVKGRPESELSNYIADRLRADVQELVAPKPVDLAITNFGGIRVDVPAGDVLVDDIVSMLPFKNYLCYLRLKGSDILHWFDYMAQNSVQCISGAQITVEDHKLVSAAIGGKKVDPNKVYGLATIDFLLDGGDGLKLARNAIEYIQSDITIGEAILRDIKALGAAGQPWEYSKDGRCIVRNDKEEED